MALQIKTVTVPKGWVARQKLSPNLGRQCIREELRRETGGLFATLAVTELAGTLCNPAQEAGVDVVQHYTARVRMCVFMGFFCLLSNLGRFTFHGRACIVQTSR